MILSRTASLEGPSGVSRSVMGLQKAMDWIALVGLV